VIAAIKAMVTSGAFPPGARLPGERELAQQLSASRPTVRQALGALVQMGVLEARQGSGTVVARSSVNVLKTPFEMLLMLEQPTVYELYEVRELVEVHLAGRAAERRTPDDLVALESALRGHARPRCRPRGDDRPQRRLPPRPSPRRPTCRSWSDSWPACTTASAPASRRPAPASGIGSSPTRSTSASTTPSGRGSATDARRAMTIHMATAIEELRWLGVADAPAPGPWGEGER
jgi:DNA-binding transcriptional regulator YhcF (GntR family)